MTEAAVRGVVHVVEETKTYGQNGFRKRLVVLEQDSGRFTNYIPVDFTNDACDTVDDLSVGSEVEISYRLNGRRWQKDSDSEVKFFLNAEATGFKVLGDKAAQSSAPESGAPSSAPSASGTTGDSATNDRLAEAAADDDVPF